MTSALPTRGQLERTLEQRIRSLYRERLGQRLEKFTCQFFDEKAVIVLEGSTTASEQLLLDNSKPELATELRTNLDTLLQPQLRHLITEAIGIELIDLLIVSHSSSGYSSITAILTSSPPVRDVETIPKVSVKEDPNPEPPVP